VRKHAIALQGRKPGVNRIDKLQVITARWLGQEGSRIAALEFWAKSRAIRTLLRSRSHLRFQKLLADGQYGRYCDPEVDLGASQPISAKFVSGLVSGLPTNWEFAWMPALLFCEACISRFEVIGERAVIR
jgi:hypothetical protein